VENFSRVFQLQRVIPVKAAEQGDRCLNLTREVMLSHEKSLLQLIEGCSIQPTLCASWGLFVARRSSSVLHAMPCTVTTPCLEGSQKSKQALCRQVGTVIQFYSSGNRLWKS